MVLRWMQEHLEHLNERVSYSRSLQQLQWFALWPLRGYHCQCERFERWPPALRDLREVRCVSLPCRSGLAELGGRQQECDVGERTNAEKEESPEGEFVDSKACDQHG